ncbi:MAG: PfkB family carbohydrate kinase [Anaeromyxobacter sp.]
MTPGGPITALHVGHVTLDRRGDGLVPGGSAWFAARALLALGASPRLATAAGPDHPADALHGLPAAVAPAPATTIFENVHGPDGRRRQRVLAAAPPLSPDALPPGPAWRRVDVLHLAPVLDELVPAAWVEAVEARVVGLGVQGLLRRLAPDGTVLQPAWTPGDLRGVGVVFVGEDDLAGQDGLVERLRAAVPVVVLTRAARGCEVHAGGRIVRVGAFPAREVDPTGAGDAFAAGWLLAAAEGAGPVEAARLGAAAGSIAVEGVGGAALGRMGEARERARAVPVLD